jgi:hypothetical protein
MKINERNEFAERVFQAIDGDDYLYDLLPGDGQDDLILETIRKIINKIRLEYPATKG